MNAKFSGNTASAAPASAASRKAASTAVKFALTDALEVICTAATRERSVIATPSHHPISNQHHIKAIRIV
jgi:hypothetical protein